MRFGNTHVINRAKLTHVIIPAFFQNGQFIGFSGSSGPSQSTIFASWELSRPRTCEAFVRSFGAGMEAEGWWVTARVPDSALGRDFICGE